MNVKKSTHVLTKILYLLNQGETFAAKEATDVFFAMTKLFQSNDIILRRLVYLGIKVNNWEQDLVQLQGAEIWSNPEKMSIKL